MEVVQSQASKTLRSALIAKRKSSETTTNQMNAIIGTRACIAAEGDIKALPVFDNCWKSAPLHDEKSDFREMQVYSDISKPL